jgi:hypothetical protein
VSEEREPRSEKLTLAQEIGSVLASFFGVQSRKNRERDFSRGNAKRFIVLGVVFTLLFVLTVIGVVRLIMRNAGL